jgi:hypothetical protein
MTKLSEQQISDNWDKLLAVIDETFIGERKEAIQKLHKYFEERMALAPAAGKEHFHNAFPGGYVDHTLRVIEMARKLEPVWTGNGTFKNFTDEELVFSALFHDLGKVGDLELDYYIPNESEWHRKNQGKIYELNPKLNYMNVTDRSFYLLNHFEIKCSQNEFLSIRLADGLYSDTNKPYLMNYDDAFSLKTNLPYIIHAADFLAMHIEYDAWKHGSTDLSPQEKKAEKKELKRKNTLAEAFTRSATEEKKPFDAKMFDDIFSDTK